MEPLVGKPMHHLQKLRTVHMDWLRKCPQQSVDPDHYGPDGQCLCPSKVTKMARLSAAESMEPRFTQPPKVIISSIMRPPPGRNQVRH